MIHIDRTRDNLPTTSTGLWTTDASPDVAPINEKATPVLLLDEGSWEMWMHAPWDLARELQRPPPRGALRVVATDKEQDS
jgi:putative SOS response-associated peptidase YedK